MVHSTSFRRLQGKMQLFPPSESPLLRNRLTHSLEVADIATRITASLNARYAGKGVHIDPSIVATAGLAHDIGHPPFGHSGEKALHGYMRGFGGFEANAQTIRILTRLENRVSQHLPADNSLDDVYRDPLGLNLLYRTIAALLKYDVMIPAQYGEEMPLKGYYEEDEPIVASVRDNVAKGVTAPNFRTIECQIMDLADDIAYATYDLEDCMVANITTPLELLAARDEIIEKVVEDVNLKFQKTHNYRIDRDDVVITLLDLFDHMIKFSKTSEYDIDNTLDKALYVLFTTRNSENLAKIPPLRRQFSERLIRNAIDAIDIVRIDTVHPAMSKIAMREEALVKLEALKCHNFHAVIMSQMLQTHQKKASRVINAIAEALESDPKSLLPEHLRRRYEIYVEESPQLFNPVERRLELVEPLRATKPEVRRRRFVCDYVAGLTDAEAMAIYHKINATAETTIFSI